MVPPDAPGIPGSITTLGLAATDPIRPEVADDGPHAQALLSAVGRANHQDTAWACWVDRLGCYRCRFWRAGRDDYEERKAS